MTDEAKPPTMNRHQRRRWQANFRRAKLESVPKRKEDNNPCDIAGCTNVWMFSTMATLHGERKVVARRCIEHRLT
jgi:hypothetical protein